MLLRNPLGRRQGRRAGWPERRLFEQVRVAGREFVLLRQALREVRAEMCDAGPAIEYLGSCPR